MKVAVDIGFQQVAYKEEQLVFIKETLSRMAILQPASKILLLVHNTYLSETEFPATIEIKRGGEKNSYLAKQWWYKIQLPSLLKKESIEVLLSFTPTPQLYSKIYQCLILADVKNLFSNAKQTFYKQLQKQNTIITLSKFSKNLLVEQFPALWSKIHEIRVGVKTSFDTNTAQKEKTKKNITAGKEFFIYPGPSTEKSYVLTLLKAFSFFKQRQQSSMKLVLLKMPDRFIQKKLESYKYRDEIIIAANEDPRVKENLLSAAYAMVYPSVFDGYCQPVLQAMQNGVPVIINADTALQEYAAAVALYANSTNQKEIAEQMMLIYKDETLHQRLVATGKEAVKKYNWDETAKMLWQVITHPKP